MKTPSLLNTNFVIIAAAMAMAITLGAGKANATLIGDTVDCSMVVDVSDRAQCNVASAMVDGNIEFIIENSVSTSFFAVDIGSSSITITPLRSLSVVTQPFSLTLSDLNWIEDPVAEITGFSLTVGGVSGGPTNFSAGNISFDAHSVTIDLFDSQWDNILNDFARIDLRTTHDITVPEPGSLALFGFGLLGLGLARRRRKTA